MRRVVEDRRRVARELGVSRRRAHRWVARFRQEGVRGLSDRSSTPRCSPHDGHRARGAAHAQHPDATREPGAAHRAAAARPARRRVRHAPDAGAAGAGGRVLGLRRNASRHPGVRHPFLADRRAGMGSKREWPLRGACRRPHPNPAASPLGRCQTTRPRNPASRWVLVLPGSSTCSGALDRLRRGPRPRASGAGPSTLAHARRSAR
ncbi:hypothetical protein B5P21_10460 [Clavibacter michiganensis subsp. insidiosus]|nr:hypothetical protein B5P21_10460 [Clavibacter michiganensis subsp. insidiosus]